MKPFVKRRSPRTLTPFTAIVGLLIFYCGCTQADRLQRAAVSGKVTLDGVEIQQGSIMFIPTGANKGPTAGGAIKDGRYAITASRGPVIGVNRVEIHSVKKTGQKVPSRMAQSGTLVDEIVEAIPDRYNTSSTLVAEIKSGSNAFDCKLTSK